MATKHFLNWVEARGERLRAKCNLKPFAQLDPFALAIQMNIPVIFPQDIPGLDAAILRQVLHAGREEWDAATIPLPSGDHVIVMNPTPCIERQRASLMEELSHVDLGHKPGRLQTVNGLVLREWKQTHETQAYWVGAAALVPRRVMKGAITLRMTVADVAHNCGVSIKLVQFRERVLGVKFIPVVGAAKIAR
jgi:hypothetical protein